MIAGSFFSGALDYNSREVQNILMIGLGGGIISNYFSTMEMLKLNITVVDIDPVMKKIAEKWYEFDPKPMKRIIVDDGLRFIREANKRGEIYDVLLVDVCYNEHRALMAPVEDFLIDEEIKEIYKILKPDDALLFEEEEELMA
ncbi:unnamed protein product [Strongylus vulgaris]|uniref:PABS domain-containing protein n=1 Tax=Strongylus vulgaris TaxID=40348 RepID=A0A3P7J0F8_STRVU|nr:unnamed protein product [Strongylus vulgaris]